MESLGYKKKKGICNLKKNSDKSALKNRNEVKCKYYVYQESCVQNLHVLRNVTNANGC